MTDRNAAIAAFLASKGATKIAAGTRAMTEGQIYAKTRDAKPKVTILGDAFPDDHAAAMEYRAMLPGLNTIERGLGAAQYRHVQMFDHEYNAAMYNFRQNTPFTSLRKLIAESIKWLCEDYNRNAAGVSDTQAEQLSAFNRKMGFAPLW